MSKIIFEELITLILNLNKEISKSRNKSRIPLPTVYYIGMEKTASKSILLGFPENKVAHWHSVEYFEFIYNTNLLSSNNIDLYDLIFYIGNKYNFKPLIIESIREPISQIISAIMQHFKKYNKNNCDCKYCNNYGLNLDFINILKCDIGSDMWINFPGKGFQSISLWKKHFNIDIFDKFKDNYMYYDMKNVKILIIRLEDSDKREKLFELIGYKYNETNANITENNDSVSQIYKYVKDNLKFTEDELNNIYDDKVKVFYSDNEIKKFKAKYII